MPYKDKAAKNRSERARRRRLADRPPLDGPGAFARWLTGAVNNKDVFKSSWSVALAAAMGEGLEYDSYLRRVAAGQVQPRPESAWAIGEGLRRCKVTWASGLSGLRYTSRFAMFCTIDIAAVNDTTKRQLAEWCAYSDILDSFDRGIDPSGLSEQFRADSVQALRQHLAVRNHILEGALAAAWATYSKSGMRDAHGLLGIAAQVWANPRSGPAAREAVLALYEQWQGDSKFTPGFNVLPETNSKEQN